MSLKSSIRSLMTMGKGMAQGLPDAAADRDPIDLFAEWFDAAKDSGILLPEAVTLATATPDGAPSARMVLLKGFSDGGFEFYTNFGSRKARELDANPKAALLAYWPVLERQARIEGTVTRMTTEESSQYFRTRARGSQLGAWAAIQSEVMERADDVRARFERYKDQFSGSDVPLPPFWGGYRVKPECIEFWQGRLNRLHDRLLFVRSETGWEPTRLYP